ncbi:target of Myb protein 1 [Artemisia annua]|uniref:Target of Myb protein 1 n=1 Tax=Artemisia annua TaxID=35608 RepID=A0A2U1MSE3_ARTAN|nr:target of Myb protein 1 [Artemisia annua]
MVETVKEKNVSFMVNMICVYIDKLARGFGGHEGRYPQYYAAYEELKTNSLPLFTPPQTHPVAAYGCFDLEASRQTVPLGLSLSGIETAREIADALMDMLNVLDPNN